MNRKMRLGFREDFFSVVLGMGEEERKKSFGEI